MLTGLSIQNVVLIDRLDLAFDSGLSALTGETGAGKSILLDSLGLALGARSDSALVRRGAAQLSVTASFAPPPDHPVHALLAEQEIDDEDELTLRRIVSAEGRSRAFVNDQPVGAGLLRRIGELLVEIHGQFETYGLLNAATHRAHLDAFGQLDLTPVRTAFTAWKDARRRLDDAGQALARAGAEEAFLRHAVEELAALSPRPGEESDLAERRQTLIHAEKLIEAIRQARALLSRDNGAETALNGASRALGRVADKAQGLLDPVIEALDRAAIEAAEATNLLDHAAGSIDLDPKALETIEERLFALRALARKHGTDTDSLLALLQRMQDELSALDAGADGLEKLTRQEKEAKAAYRDAARALSATRAETAQALDRAVAGELAPLKLDRARFQTRITPLAEENWGETGIDGIAFEVATNPGAEPAPLARIASGGELSRLMLALEVVLAEIGGADTIVFDEVDNAIGGAVADAVGERLARLAERMQVLAVTHSPQVAARASHHWRVAKGEDGSGAIVTRVAALSLAERREEIARMLSGAKITDPARAAADALLKAAHVR